MYRIQLLELSIFFLRIILFNSDYGNYLDCMLDNQLSGEAMALKALSKRAKILARKAAISFLVLAPYSRAGQCIYDSAAPLWYNISSQLIKNRIQVAQISLI